MNLKLFEKDILIYKKGDEMLMSINIDIIEQIDFGTADLYVFSSEVNDFVKIDKTVITSISIYSKSKKIVEKTALDFLANHFKLIRKLNITCACQDISVLSVINNLESITLHNKIEIPFDFSVLNNLKSATFFLYDESLDCIFDCKSLQVLEIHKYLHKSFAKFIQLKGLQTLLINQGRLSELTNINQLENLSVFAISHNRTLSDLSPLQHNKNLKKLTISNCPKIKNYDAISQTAIEALTLENQKYIPSLNFVRTMEKLRDLAILGTSNVIDGKLKWLLNRKKIQFSCEVRKHYDVKWVQAENGDYILESKEVEKNS